MKPMSRIQVKLPPNDHTALKIKSVQEHRTLSEELEETLVELMAGNLEIEEEKESLKATALTISTSVANDFEAYCKKEGKPMNTMLRLAVAAKLKTQPELFAAIDALKHKRATTSKALGGLEITERLIQQMIHESRRLVPITPEERDAAVAALTCRTHDAYLGNTQ